MTGKVIKLPKPPEPVEGFPGCVYCPECGLAWGREDMSRCPHCRSEACDDCVEDGWCCRPRSVAAWLRWLPEETP